MIGGDREPSIADIVAVIDHRVSVTDHRAAVIDHRAAVIDFTGHHSRYEWSLIDISTERRVRVLD